MPLSNTITITLTKEDMLASVQSLIWKHGEAIDNGENYRQVYGVKADGDNNAVDHRVLADAWERHAMDLCDMMRDYGASVTETTGTKTISLGMSARWASNDNTLKSLCDKYVSDGIIAEWYKAVDPNEAAAYITRMEADRRAIRSNIYSLNPPTYS